jgi:hypothetical protein
LNFSPWLRECSKIVAEIEHGKGITLIETPNAQAMVDAVEPWFAGGYAIL